MSTIQKDIQKVQTPLGRGYAIIGAVMATIIALALFIAGLYLIIKPDYYTVSTNAKIINVTCELTSTTRIDHTCEIIYAYEVNGVTYVSEFILTMAKTYAVNDNIRIQYNPNNPQMSRLYQTPPLVIGSLLVGVGIVLALIAWFLAWFSRRSVPKVVS